MQTSNPIPVYLITGLLGSGKTTLLSKLLQQQPAGQKWAVLVNEFGEIDIDTEILKHSSTNTVLFESVKGGCICCSANHFMHQALQKLIAQKPDVIWIEPTGLGHPAGIMDTLQKFPEIKLKLTLGLITPKQLTTERWQKSAVMRDLMTLADAVLLSQTDLATPTEIHTALDLLAQLYPQKIALWQNSDSIEFGDIQKMQPIAFKIRENAKLTTDVINVTLEAKSSKLQSLCTQIDAQTKQIKAIGCTFPHYAVFNRLKLKSFFADYSVEIVRSKGILRTGKEWQLLQWHTQQFALSDIAWRQDSRIECLFSDQIAWRLDAQNELPKEAYEWLEQLTDCMN